MARKKSKLKGRIIAAVALSDHPLTPKEISGLLGIKHSSTVRKYCRDLVATNELKLYDDRRGQYITPAHIIRDSKAVMEPLLLHGIKLEFKDNSKVGGCFRLVARQVTMRGRRHRINKSISDSYEFEGRVIIITEHEKAGLIEVWLKSTNDSLDLAAFERFLSWLAGYYPTIIINQWQLIQLGLNWDRHDIKLAGITSMTLQSFHNFWIQIYQKTSGMVRVEGHLTTRISLADALEVLKDCAASIERLNLIRR